MKSLIAMAAAVALCGCASTESLRDAAAAAREAAAAADRATAAVQASREATLAATSAAQASAAAMEALRATIANERHPIAPAEFEVSLEDCIPNDECVRQFCVVQGYLRAEILEVTDVAKDRARIVCYT